MGEMASSVAHELNQPLTAITNYCTGMISRIRGGQINQDELLGALEKTARQAQRAGQVIQRIRSFVKRSEPRRQWSDVAPIVEQVVELAEHRAAPPQGAPGAPRGTLAAGHVGRPDPDRAGADEPDQERRRDAIDGAEVPLDERVVDLRVTQREIEGVAAVQFCVTDAGPGLSTEAIERLYEAFFSTKSEGMGIGLNLCRSIVESHQGRITPRTSTMPAG
jgi:signal transduction histidine kinase